MKLSDLESMKLMPRYATAYEFACKALDSWMEETHGRADALSSPWTLEGIAALTEEELQQAYKIYSLADYYQELPRDIRNRFLFEQIVNIRKRGTVEALTALMRYIYPDMTVTFDDVLAFDENGNIIDSNLLHRYGITINLDLDTLPEYVTGRILDNLKRFMRATAALESISYVTTSADIESTLPTAVNDFAACIETESADVDAESWGIYGYYPIGLDNGNAGTVNQMSAAITNSGAVPWTITQTKNWATLVSSGNKAATPSILMRSSSVFFQKEEAKRIVGIFYDATLTASVTTKLRDGQFGIYKNAPAISEIEHLYRSAFE
jgi:hypothetical protein